MDRKKKISVGWLFPYSSIFTRLKTDLQQGLSAGLSKDGSDLELQAFPEFIQTGSLKDVEKALQKLLHYEQVDLVIGVLSTKVAVNIIALLEQSRTPMILLNLGADIPVSAVASDYLFYDSMHLWKSEWAIGRWMQTRFGGEPSLNISVYEGGYGLQEAFKAGAASAGADTMKLNLVKNFSPSPDVSPLIQYLEEQSPSHAHVLLSGKEGEQFIQLFQQRGLAGKIQLSVNPFMAEDGMRFPRVESSAEELVMYSAQTWSYSLDTACNQFFTGDYEQRYGERPNAFSLLAFEAGLALAAAIGAGADEGCGVKFRQELAMELREASPTGPRGIVRLSTMPLETLPAVYIRQSFPSALHGLENKIVDTLGAIEWNDPSLSVDNQFYSGWQNPYLCV